MLNYNLKACEREIEIFWDRSGNNSVAELWLVICSKIKYMYATKNICMQPKKICMQQKI